MRTLRRNSWWMAAMIVLATWTAAARATIITIWSEDFSDVSDWQVIADPGGGSTITSDGNLGQLYVNAGGNLAAFGPKTDGSSALVLFDPSNKDAYAMNFVVDNLTWSDRKSVV